MTEVVTADPKKENLVEGKVENVSLTSNIEDSRVYHVANDEEHALPLRPSSDLPQPETGKGFLKPLNETTLLERLAAVVAATAIATAVAAIVVEQSAVVIVAGVLSAIVGPYAYWQQTRLADIKALEKTQHAIQAEVDKLQAENHGLARNVREVTTSLQHLEDVQQALGAITSTQGASIDIFRRQLKENKKILKQMQSNIKATVLQNLLSVMLRTDTNGNLAIDDEEFSALIRRIQNISGVKVNEARFRTAVAGMSLEAVMGVVKDLLLEQSPVDERVFELSQ
jgi:glutaredoxin 2